MRLVNPERLYADWCVALKAGRLHCTGPWSDTMTSAVLSDLYDTPLRLASADGATVVVNAD
ncbi:hypothetical protein P1J78_13010 [Psychromarinibacter sp. C21-152]|uniref:Iron complex transport system ATP-binding protein n=1 Tax=Psychromarinibacter sediminicola TaxID=3033385 RepID=A0AAE3T8Z0_9RHOB|nr:hypothetical protein [Psychromarinibacter sediminicola]MDF0601657.1 hypothetical protein [Psychromarinibacter sediminicola]